MSRLAPLIVVVAALNAPILPAQQPLIVRGRVVRADAPAMPLPRVRVSPNVGGALPEAVFTDDQGRFEIALPAAATTITAVRTGFVTTSLTASTRTPSEPIEIRLLKGGVISGRVIDPTAGPVVNSGVRVRLLDTPETRGASQSWTFATTTNDLGEFRVAGLAGGQYEVNTYRDFDERERQQRDDVNQDALGAFRLPVVTTGAPEWLSDPTEITVRAGQEYFVTISQRVRPMEPHDTEASAAITGVVLDDFGGAAEGIKVRLWGVRIANGQRVVTQIGPSSTTDDEGRYRLFRLRPGWYLVEAVGGDAWHYARSSQTPLAPVYYPGTTTVDQATRLQIKAGQEMNGVNIAFTPRHLARVHGFALNATGQPLRGTVGLTSMNHAGAVAMPARTTTTTPAGAFEFLNVAPGNYVVRAARTTLTQPSTAQQVEIGGRFVQVSGPIALDRTYAEEFGMRFLSVGESDQGPVTVTTSPTARLAGRIQFDSASAAPSTTDVRLAAMVVDPDARPDLPRIGTGSAVIKSDWSFEIPGLTGPTRLTLRSPRGWWLKSVLTPTHRSPNEPIDVAGGDVTIVLARTSAAVSGRVLDQDNKPAGRIGVIVFAVDDDRWYSESPSVRTAVTDANGRFTIDSLPPDEYFIVALATEGEPAVVVDVGDPNVLRAISYRSRRIVLPENLRATTDLHVSALSP